MLLNKKIITNCIISLLLLCTTCTSANSINTDQKKIIQITPSQVFTETQKLHAEIDILGDFFNLPHQQPLFKLETTDSFAETNIKPRHVWQLAYMVMVKVNLLRTKYDLPRIEEVGMEPVLYVNPNMPYGQLKRLLTEIRLIKDFFGVKEKIPEFKPVTGKQPRDVFNELLYLSIELNNLIQQQITPSSVFSQVMRLYNDISPIFQVLNINDNSTPPPKNNRSESKDSYKVVQKFIIQLKKIQRMADIERTSFLFLYKTELKPEDTFILVSMAIAELQTIKAYLGLNYLVTPPAHYYSDKTAADVEQLMQWTARRLNLIESLEAVNAK